MRMPWDSDRFARQVREILASVEAPPVDARVRLSLQRDLYRSEKFDTDGRGHVTLLIRTILESENNGDALIEPIVTAVSICMSPEWTSKGLAWIEAFDRIPLTSILQQMRSLDLFSEKTIGSYLAIAIRNKLAAILEPAAQPVMKPVQLRRKLKPPRSLTRVPGVERNIGIGLELLALRSTIKNNLAFGRQVRRQFDVDGQHACEVMKVARAYGTRPEIFTKLSWNALLYLASPALPAAARQALEARIIAGERIGAPEIRAARGAPKAAVPTRKPDQLAQRKAA